MKKEIVVVGGGFAGINLIKQLKNEPNIHLTLVDKNNYNFFPPLLYQVATGFLEVTNISYPYRKILRNQENANFHMGELLEINSSQKEVVLSTGKLKYDKLIIALGTVSNYFGNEHIKANSLPMKTVNDALELRNYIFQKTEDAVLERNPIERKKLLTIVIAGGGPTGVEVAGMLAEMQQYIFEKDYPELGGQPVNIYLVDGSETLLSPMSEKAQSYTLKTLENSGVIVKLNTRVKDYFNDEVVFENGEKILTKTLIWTAGVTSTKLKGLPEECFGPGKRIKVNEYNELIGIPDIYAIGDNCIQLSDRSFPNGHPQMAQVALQQGKNLGKNLINELQHKSKRAFKYKDKGSMAIIGRSKASADIPNPHINLTGWLAWIMWLFVHLFSLIGYRNRFKTMVNWTTAYFTKDQTLRMIIRPNLKKIVPKD
jgi:NADH dehydrogenase